MKRYFGLLIFLLIAAALSGCGGKVETPITQRSSTETGGSFDTFPSAPSAPTSSASRSLPTPSAPLSSPSPQIIYPAPTAKESSPSVKEGWPPLQVPKGPPAPPYKPWQGLLAYSEGLSGKLWLISPNRIQKGIVALRTIVCSPDGNYLALFHPNLLITDRNGKTISAFERKIEKANWLSDSSALLAGIRREGIFLFSLEGEEQKLLTSSNNAYDYCPVESADKNWIYFLHFEANKGTSLCRAARDEFLQGKSDYKTCQELFQLTKDNRAIEIAILNNGKIIAFSSEQIILFNPLSQKIEKEIEGRNIEEAKLAPNGLFLAFLDRYGVEIFDPLTFDYQSTIKVAGAQTFAWSPDNEALAIVTFNNYGDEILIWRFADQRLQEICSRNFSPSAIKKRGGAPVFALTWMR